MIDLDCKNKFPKIIPFKGVNEGAFMVFLEAI
jgi:hypothetical protein